VLIISSEIFGLSKSEMNLISLISRYHRKSPPKPSHIEYMALPMHERVIVSRLAAILRVADALDNIHNQVAEDITVNLLDTKCEIQVKMRIGEIEYFDIIKSAVKSKGDLFELFFGVPISMEIKV
jgi:exopolyphosphatase/guanosine-5'-triphosphate,3'-diphosphate pyrophosphatase